MDDDFVLTLNDFEAHDYKNQAGAFRLKRGLLLCFIISAIIVLYSVFVVFFF